MIPETTPLLFFNKLHPIFQSSFILVLESPENFISSLWFRLGKLYFPVPHNLLTQLYKNQIVFLAATDNAPHFKQHTKKNTGFQLIRWFMTNPFWAVPIYTFICRVLGDIFLAASLDTI